MIILKRTTIIAGAAVLAASLALPGAANAGYLDKFDADSFKEARSNLKTRLKTSESNNEDRPKIKLDRARLRRIIDRFLTKD